MKATARCAVLTPPGAAAVATIAIIGQNAWSVVCGAFRGRLPEIPHDRCHWVGEFGTAPGDTVVISVRQSGPASWVEIHCHGGMQVVRWIVAELKAHGATETNWQDLVGNWGLSPLQVNAARELTRAVTVRTSAILLDQFQGALDVELDAIRALLSDEQIEQAHDRLSVLQSYSQVGRHLTIPWRVVVAGAPNVGKSSLINRLVGYPRCLVTAIAGTTRDLVSTSIAIDGWPIDLIDTAGQRQSADPLESVGVKLGQEMASQADLVLWLFDGEPPNAPRGHMKVRNKIDVSPLKSKVADVFPISALTGESLDELLAVIAKRLVPLPPPTGAAVPFTAEIADRIALAANRLAAGNVNECVAILERLTQGD